MLHPPVGEGEDHFVDDAPLARALSNAAAHVADPVWRLPFQDPDEAMIEPGIADLDNAPFGGFAGAITAALFLEHFVEPEIPWVHIDTFAWNQVDRPGRPQGGEALGLRAVFRYLQQRYA